jgi:hypothetical protein
MFRLFTLRAGRPHNGISAPPKGFVAGRDFSYGHRKLAQRIRLRRFH